MMPFSARRSWLAGALAATGCLAAGPLAAALEPPAGPTILKVVGAIGVGNVDDEAHFDRAGFDALGRTQLVTWTPWTRGDTVFEGVLGTTLLDAVQAGGTVALCHALNDYDVEIPLDDFRRYRTLLATHMNGAMLTPRDKGPIWVVFPWSDHPELDTRQARQRSIWQLVEMTIR